MEEKLPCVGPYQIIGSLGQGTTGKVKLAIHKTTKQKVALKIIKLVNHPGRVSANFKVHREIALMRLISHPHVLKLVDVFESPSHLYIALEYASKGELYGHLVEKTRFNEKEAMVFFRQIIYGVEYLHSLGISHRDLKPENLLLDENLNIKIADFGFAKFTKEDIASTSCGSPHYAAPEVISGTPYDRKKADIWSCGVILFALLAGFLPFDDPNIRNLLQKVKTGRYSFPAFFSPGVQHLIKGMLTINPNQRITIEQIKAHPVFREGISPAYIFPSPLPLPMYSTPIPLDQVSEEILSVLSKIGYDDEDILEQDLLSPTFSMAKVFYFMLCRQTGINALNWDKSFGSASYDGQTDEFYQEAAPSSFYGFGPSSVIRDGVSFGQNTIGAYSFADRPEWAQNDSLEGDPIIKTAQIPTGLYETTQIMYTIQNELNQLEMQWFHPDDYTIIARSVEDALYMSVSSIQSNQDGQIVLEVLQYSGYEESFDSVVDTFQSAFEPYYSGI